MHDIISRVHDAANWRKSNAGSPSSDTAHAALGCRSRINSKHLVRRKKKFGGQPVTDTMSARFACISLVFDVAERNCAADPRGTNQMHNSERFANLIFEISQSNAVST